jgi:hypothetical protein
MQSFKNSSRAAWCSRNFRFFSYNLESYLRQRIVPKETQASIAVEKAIAVAELVIFASFALYVGSIRGINAVSTKTLAGQLRRRIVLLVYLAESPEQNE